MLPAVDQSSAVVSSSVMLSGVLDYEEEETYNQLFKGLVLSGFICYNKIKVIRMLRVSQITPLDLFLNAHCSH